MTGADDPTQVVSYLLGQAGEHLLQATGWIGDHPSDGSDVAHLLVQPAGHGAADKIRLLAGGLGCGPALDGTLVDVPPDLAYGTLADAREGMSVWLSTPCAPVLHRPVPPDWQTAARAHGWIILTIGMDPYIGRTERDLNRYLSRAHRLYMGRVSLIDTSQEPR